MKFIDVALSETAVVMPEKELRQIINEAEFYEQLFLDLLRVCLNNAGKDTSMKEIERWIWEHYIDIRKLIPDDLKQLYLRKIAFRAASN